MGCVQRSSVNETTARVKAWTYTILTPTVLCPVFTRYRNNSRVMVWLHPRSCSVQRSLTTAIIAESRLEPTQPTVTATVVCPTFISYWNNSRVRVWVSELSSTSTETTRLIRDGEKGGSGYGGGGRRLYTYRYTVTTIMTPALRWAATMWAILIFH